MAQTIQERREQFHLSRLDDILGPLNPHVHSFLERGQAFFMQQTGDPARSQQMTVQVLADLRQQQAASLAYFDVFWLCAALGVATRRSGAADEALGGREGRARRRGMKARVRRTRSSLAQQQQPGRWSSKPRRALDTHDRLPRLRQKGENSSLPLNPVNVVGVREFRESPARNKRIACRSALPVS